MSAESIAENYFLVHGWLLERRRWKTPFAEIDLFFKKGQTCLLVEVKSVGSKSEDFLELRVSPRQTQKLLQARLWVEEMCQQDVIAVVALVMESEGGRVRVIPLGS
ncbi:MAG: YraN family protein [Bdellovibrionales bacterium]|nr:YraN family protein [Bdellovibrionales bacterium]